MPRTYIDLFAGCGGLSLGLHNAGWEGLFAIEKSNDAFSSLRYNLIDNIKHFSWVDWLPCSPLDIDKVLLDYKDQIIELRGKVDMVVGGPPCQGFSLAGKRIEHDRRNLLIDSYVDFIRLIMPQIILFENVHGFTVSFISEGEKSKNYSEYVKCELEKLGYTISGRIIDMSNFGVPQKRKRYIMVGCLSLDPSSFFCMMEEQALLFLSKKGLVSPVNTKSAIDDLKKYCGMVPSPDAPQFKAGLYGEASSSYQQLMRKSDIAEGCAVDSHRFANHTLAIELQNRAMLDHAPRGKRITPSDGIVTGLQKRGITILDPNQPAPTVTSIPDDFVHYDEPRILTVRETARIQSFPDWFEFKGKYTTGGKRRKKETPRYTQVANAVPPLFAEQAGLVLKEMLDNARE